MDELKINRAIEIAKENHLTGARLDLYLRACLASHWNVMDHVRESASYYEALTGKRIGMGVERGQHGLPNADCFVVVDGSTRYGYVKWAINPASTRKPDLVNLTFPEVYEIWKRLNPSS